MPLQDRERVASFAEQKLLLKPQFKLEDTVLYHHENRMEIYRKKSKSAQVASPRQQPLIQH